MQHHNTAPQAPSFDDLHYCMVQELKRIAEPLAELPDDQRNASREVHINLHQAIFEIIKKLNRIQDSPDKNTSNLTQVFFDGIKNLMNKSQNLTALCPLMQHMKTFVIQNQQLRDYLASLGDDKQHPVKKSHRALGLKFPSYFADVEDLNSEEQEREAMAINAKLMEFKDKVYTSSRDTRAVSSQPQQPKMHDAATAMTPDRVGTISRQSIESEPPAEAQQNVTTTPSRLAGDFRTYSGYDEAPGFEPPGPAAAGGQKKVTTTPSRPAGDFRTYSGYDEAPGFEPPGPAAAGGQKKVTTTPSRPAGGFSRVSRYEVAPGFEPPEQVSTEEQAPIEEQQKEQIPSPTRQANEQQDKGAAILTSQPTPTDTSDYSTETTGLLVAHRQQETRRAVARNKQLAPELAEEMLHRFMALALVLKERADNGDRCQFFYLNSSRMTIEGLVQKITRMVGELRDAWRNKELTLEDVSLDVWNKLGGFIAVSVGDTFNGFIRAVFIESAESFINTKGTLSEFADKIGTIKTSCLMSSLDLDRQVARLYDINHNRSKLTSYRETSGFTNLAVVKFACDIYCKLNHPQTLEQHFQSLVSLIEQSRRPVVVQTEESTSSNTSCCTIL